MVCPRSITAFFPAYNDGGTIPSMVLTALLALRQLTEDYEIVVVNDGSSDYTAEVLEELARRYPELRVIHHPQNRGYGGALRTGFRAASKEWVFYTDGDAQYDPRELTVLVAALDDGVDVVNGYKITRHDPISRRAIGRVYHHLVRLLFGFKLRDVACDFRLIRRSIFDEIELESNTGTICLEMVKKFQMQDMPLPRCRCTTIIVSTAHPSSSIGSGFFAQPGTYGFYGGNWWCARNTCSIRRAGYDDRSVSRLHWQTHADHRGLGLYRKQSGSTAGRIGG
jgi:glycosyltransferase involved in cell wall biosynthesis